MYLSTSLQIWKQTERAKAKKRHFTGGDVYTQISPHSLAERRPPRDTGLTVYHPRHVRDPLVHLWQLATWTIVAANERSTSPWLAIQRFEWAHCYLAMEQGSALCEEFENAEYLSAMVSFFFYHLYLEFLNFTLLYGNDLRIKVSIIGTVANESIWTTYRCYTDYSG